MKKKEYLKERELINLIKNRNQHKNGFIKCWKGLTLNHWIVTCQIAHKLINNGWKVFSEAEFENGRADLVAINGGTGVIYEIMESEKLKNIEEKIKKYPKQFIIIPIKCSEFDINSFKI
ncbi:MAG: hypothetical protein ACFFG0_03230 [Candidatus Thorarchaeota archaeon]